jgi:hypothetical protein
MELIIHNIPDLADPIDKNIFCSRISNAVNDILSKNYKIPKPNVSVSSGKVSGSFGEKVENTDDPPSNLKRYKKKSTASGGFQKSSHHQNLYLIFMKAARVKQ